MSRDNNGKKKKKKKTQTNMISTMSLVRISVCDVVLWLRLSRAFGVLGMLLMTFERWKSVGSEKVNSMRVATSMSNDGCCQSNQ